MLSLRNFGFQCPQTNFTSGLGASPVNSVNHQDLGHCAGESQNSFTTTSTIEVNGSVHAYKNAHENYKTVEQASCDMGKGKDFFGSSLYPSAVMNMMKGIPSVSKGQESTLTAGDWYRQVLAPEAPAGGWLGLWDCFYSNDSNEN